MALGWSLTLHTPATSDWTKALVPNLEPMYFAFLGAYFFSIQALFRRYIRRDLLGSAYVGVSLRVIVAIIGTWVAVQLLPSVMAGSVKTIQESTASTGAHGGGVLPLVIGFTIGIFPPLIWQMLRQFMNKSAWAAAARPYRKQSSSQYARRHKSVAPSPSGRRGY